jgi:hypothetical protein
MARLCSLQAGEAVQEITEGGARKPWNRFASDDLQSSKMCFPQVLPEGGICIAKGCESAARKKAGNK